MIDRIISAYKARKLMLQAQEVQQGNVKEEGMLYDDVAERMRNAYKRNKRKKKIDKLKSIETHWKGLS